MAVDVLRACERDLLQLGGVAGDDAGEVHHLGDAEHAPPPEETLEVAAGQRPVRRLEVRGRNARRGHEVEVELQAFTRVEQPVDAVGAEHVRELVRIEDDGRRPERQDEPRELVGKQLRALEVHVRVDEAGDDPPAGGVHHLAAVVLPQAGDPPVCDSDVGFQPLAREHREHAAAAEDEVGGLVPARHGNAACKG